MARTQTPKTRQEALDLAEMWDQAADAETDNEVDFQKFRSKAARYRAMADKLPSKKA